ncbi:MAG: hypothetical protein P8L66_10750 [Rhodospirillaceae bacterium]|nr:hypothetical protein [Rhodospirillaceae bacterium]
MNSDFVIILPLKAAASFSKAALQEHPGSTLFAGDTISRWTEIDKHPPGTDDLFALDAIAEKSAAALSLAEVYERGGGIPVNVYEAGFFI